VLCQFVRWLFHQHAILSFCHFVILIFFNLSFCNFFNLSFCNLSFNQLIILLAGHSIFYQFATLMCLFNFPLCHFTIIFYLSFCPLAILSTFHVVNLPFHLLIFLSTQHFTMPFCQFVITSTYYLVIVPSQHLVNMLDCYSVNLSLC